ncbi:hypothetical protein BVRB_039900, partial [Beta vulgaris subsp. vulgaris]
RPRPVNFQLRSGTAEARNEGAIPVRSALKEVQEMFPEPLDSADERDPGSDCDSIDSEDAEKKISTPPHHASLRNRRFLWFHIDSSILIIFGFQ